MPHQHDARQLCKRLDDVEVAERAHFEKRHAVLFCVRPCLFCGDLSLECQVQPVTHKNTGYTRCVLRIDRDKKVDYKRGMGGPERWEWGIYTVLSGWVNLKQCHSLPVSFIYSMRPSYLCLSQVHREKSTHPSLGAILSSRKWQKN